MPGIVDARHGDLDRALLAGVIAEARLDPVHGVRHRLERRQQKAVEILADVGPLKHRHHVGFDERVGLSGHSVDPPRHGLGEPVQV